MVGLPAFVLPLAQLVLYPALQPAPFVHALALWIAAAQTPAAQAAFSHQAESRGWRQSTELLDEPRVPSGHLASPTIPASRIGLFPSGLGAAPCGSLGSSPTPAGMPARLWGDVNASGLSTGLVASY
jgi:hypothetical protein